ncbi:MAG: amino acid amidase [Clostridiales bacterium]|nr:amino acid amidase [Clostridiales bacterium]
MKRIFLSADIEGTCGIAHWDETEKTHQDYAYFANQMTLEVQAACNGALAGGASEILVKDAHDSGRNINPVLLPKEASVFRGWARDLYGMMSGIKKGDAGVFFTGYHSSSGRDGNPLAHTMNGQNNYIKINGEKASELHINGLIASHFQVPVRFVCADEALCTWIKEKVPQVVTVETIKGVGNGTISLHPEVAIEKIRQGAEASMSIPTKQLLFPMEEEYEIEINYKNHYLAKRNGHYPGAMQKDSHTIVYKSTLFVEVLRFILFCL